MAKPSSKITPEQLDEFRGLVFEVMPEMLAEYIEVVRVSTDVEDRRKFLAWATSVVGAEAKKDDAKPQLPVFNFQFSLGNIQAAQDSAAKALEVVDQITDAIEVPQPTFDFVPSALPPAALDEMLAAFEDLKGATKC